MLKPILKLNTLASNWSLHDLTVPNPCHVRNRNTFYKGHREVISNSSRDKTVSFNGKCPVFTLCDEKMYHTRHSISENYEIVET